MGDTIATLVDIKQDEETAAAFRNFDLQLADLLGLTPETRLLGDNTVEGIALSRVRGLRVQIAKEIMVGFSRQPQMPGNIAQMADWAVLSADVLMQRLATARAMMVAVDRVQAPPSGATN